MRRAVVVGMGVTGRAVAVALRDRGVVVDAIDDRITEEMRSWSRGADIPVSSSAPGELAGVLTGADAVLPAPGLPDNHPTFAAADAAGVNVYSELDLAHMWDDRPVVAITGTDGKTTVVTLVERMLTASGIPAAAVGNTDMPFVTAIDDPATRVFVVEASSFRLGHSRLFSPHVGAWLNFGPDHLDNHSSLENYEAAKASIWARLRDGGLALGNLDDPVVHAHLRPLVALQRFDVETFGASSTATHHVVDGSLVVAGESLIDVADLARGLPHDVLNGLAAAACALRAGACRSAAAEVLRTFAGLPHRAELIAELDGVTYVNDSKATTPHAAEAAIGAYDSVVLLAGGRNKGLDLSGLARHADRVRHVVGLGEAGDAVIAAFGGLVPSSRATNMAEALDAATAVARPGDVVLLSPACASFDWYSSYRERGDDFAQLVRERAEGPSQ